MVFTQTEIVYYAAVLLFGALGGFCRLLLDKSDLGLRRGFGSVLAAGIWTFASVGLWVGRNPDSVVGPVYYLAVAVFVGYFTREVTDFSKTVIKSVLRGIFKRLGFEIEEESNS